MQIVGYETPDGALYVTDSDAAPDAADSASVGVDRVALEPGDSLDWTLGDRHCAGTIHDGSHVGCDAAAAPYCRDHRSTWVCARCTGTCLKDEMDCFDDHAVYLAAFAPDTVKVGVTKEWRLDTRLREQGADRAAHVRTVENGRLAREIEAGIAEHIPDRVRVPTKIDGLAAAVDDDAWDAVLADYDPIETFSFDYGLGLDDRPVAETLASGTVVGTKGRILVLENAGTAYAVDMRDLVGHEIRVGDDGDAGRDVQSSLGAFG
ncbi:DUF2797 domain-containing protein [Halobaculum sp. P14]|uniref:DUF2797 domain-containing protein n=1 Tax=Halobaculum sp. P14 TaxID=3421638 RepID=UPI003EBCEA3B